MESTRNTTVLFAAFVETEKLYAVAGDTPGQEAIKRCLEMLRGAAATCGGRMAKMTQDRAMVLINSPDAAADASVAMHTAMDTFPAVGAVKLALGIGFHHGAVIQKDEEVFGDTVNLAARIVEQAAKDQVITTQETAHLLSPIYRPWIRKLGKVGIKGRSGEVEISELVWRADDSATLVAKKRQDRPAHQKLKLKYKGLEVVRRREKDAVIIGRDPSSGLVVDDDQVSRHHCSIERRHDKFVITDTSSNGTYVTIQGEPEVMLNREDLTLSKRGWICFGQPKVAAKETVEFITY